MNAYTILYQSVPDWENVPIVELHHTDWLPEAPIRAWAQLCRDDQGLWVRLEAEEANVRATLSEPLDEVYQDSCLEFFFAPIASDSRYLNFEFNPLGNIYLGFGSTRPNCQLCGRTVSSCTFYHGAGMGHCLLHSLCLYPQLLPGI